MNVFQAFLLGVIYFLGNSALIAGPVGYYTVYRPLVAGFLTGLVLGDPVTGTIVGATINLMYIGFIAAGGALPGDPCLAGVMGTALAITSNLQTEAAVALAIPIGLLGTLIWFGRLTISAFFAHKADQLAREGKSNKIWMMNVLAPQGFLFLICFTPVFIAALYGTSSVESLINYLGGNILHILIVIGGMMPALGIGLNLKAIYKGDARVFFFIGFLITAYFELSMITVGFLALCVAIVYMQLKEGSSLEWKM
ncbi:PTS sugar transporter subunit IIC [Alkalibaculum sp. M08DMB]|uniref:PTS sugar transporter subunit IIC n=1 Tax=Alkalibaculum sporogenes TaxID=2655001 RepID=A0A6A7K877_9FIRM|nr:PTS sugar transporter subunit IIC [Alkalibaculum sporogenes]MPW25624.1 PTS sugar transporter subunit IIC [Alkalibaculum sporogenes]